jgi:hypothetical protein
MLDRYRADCRGSKAIPSKGKGEGNVTDKLIQWELIMKLFFNSFLNEHGGHESLSQFINKGGKVLRDRAGSQKARVLRRRK